jgi:undecaprenyl-diphosphatase
MLHPMLNPQLLDSHLAPATFALTVFGLFALCLLLALAGRWLAHGLQPAWRWLEHRRSNLARGLPTAPGPALRLPIWLLRRNLSELATLAIAGLLLLGAGAVFIETLEAVLEPERLAQLDREVFNQLQALRRDWLDAIMVAVTELGGAWVTLPLGIVVASWLLATHRRAAAAYWIGAYIASRLSVMVLKTTLGRDRPINLYEGWEAYSFPSGHATISMVAYGFLWVLLGSRQPWLARSALFAGAVVLIGLIGFSRLYLGVHWLSDVIAGFALGLGWITLLALAYRLFHGGGKLPLRVLAPLVLATLTVAWGWRCWQAFPQLLEHYRPAATAAQPAPDSSSRSWRLSTLPLALRGSGSLRNV